jgi:uncharacterized membrane protein
MSIPELLSQIPNILAGLIGAFGILVIVIGVAIAMVEYVRGMLFERHRQGEDITKHHVDPIRVELGRYINFGLELLIAKDVIETIFAPTWTEIIQFFALVVIRTIVSYFLIYEVDKIDQRRRRQP